MEDKSPVAARIFVECSAGILCSALVSPAVAIIDRATVSNASGLEPLIPSLINSIKILLTNPLNFVRQPSFLIVMGLYSGTYMVANSIEAVCDRSQQSSFYPKFVGSSITNVTLCLMKDRAFARMFGTGDPKPMPKLSMGLFATRDSMTILASFSLPPVLSQRLQSNTSIKKETANAITQLLTPVTVQLFSAPLDLYALDLYNRNIKVPTSDRINFIRRKYFKHALARMARIVPAFGVGGILNKYLRKEGRKQLDQFYSK